MSGDLANLAICPACWSDALQWADNDAAVCTSCTTSFPGKDGVWYAIVPDRSWAPVLQDTISLFMDFTANRDAAESSLKDAMQQSIEEYSTEHEAERDARFWEIWRQLNIGKQARILEIGAGDLRLTSQIHQQGYEIIAVEPVPEYLTRGKYDRDLPLPKICCSAGRLPFASGAFDVVFCQATLHHLEDIALVLREMGRVLRPGGLLLAAMEPVSACFRRNRRVRESMPDQAFDIGINEQLPTLSTYLSALRRAGIVNIHMHAKPNEWDLPYRLRRLPFLRSFLPSDPIVHGWRMRFRGSLTSGQASFHGRKWDKPTAHPLIISPEQFAFSPADYIHRRDRKHLTAIWKALIDPAGVPSTIRIGQNDLESLRRGFSRRRQEQDGFPYKWLLAQGAFFLRVPSGCRRLRVTLKYPEAGGEFPITAVMDSKPLPQPTKQPANRPGWIILEWKLPAAAPPGVCDFLLQASQLTSRDKLPTSIKIHRVECC